MVMDPLKSSEWWCDGRMIHLMNESEVVYVLNEMKNRM